MLARFFIERPIFAWVVSIVILLAGGVAALTLPIAQYPDITPPTVQVTANYPGASATVVADSVASPIEQQVNGVENMLYMSSQCTNDGLYTLTITFDLGTDMDTAQVLVQNRVALAMAQLPELVQTLGVSTKKRSPSILLAVSLFSPDERYDDVYLSNYATIQIKDELLRVSGVGDVMYFGQRDYSMRVWLDPDKLAARDLTTADVINAVKSQNVQVAAGQVGQPPTQSGQQFQYTMSTLGRLSDEQQFGNIIIKASYGNEGTAQTSSQVVRLRDVARIELGAQQYSQICELDGQASVALAIFQSPGSNALDTADAVKRKMEELKERFPDGLEYMIGYDTTPFIRESVSEVFHTLRDAVILVALVVLVFLQDWKAMILPMIDVPVSLVGTFAVMVLLGFNLNTLTLFGLVLAIGIVVDDAIVVLENVERQIAAGYDPKTATIKAMDEVTGPIVAITLVLCAVFVPSAFLPGVIGQFYRQFALTISAAMVISAINAMTLTPSRAVAIFKSQAQGKEPQHEALPWWIFGVVAGVATLSWLADPISRLFGVPVGEAARLAEVPKWKTYGVAALAFLPGAVVGGLAGRRIIQPVNRVLSRWFTAFNRVFDRTTEHYGRAVGRMARMSAIVLVVYGGLLALTVWQLQRAPKGFIPVQDQGYLLVNVQLPDSASLSRTNEIMRKISLLAQGDPNDPKQFPGIPGVSHTLAISGQSVLLSANASNFGSTFVVLEPFEKRHGIETYDETVAEKLRELCAEQVDGAIVSVFRAPPIQGLGTAGGFRFQIEQRGYVDLAELDRTTQEVVAAGDKDARLTGLFSMYSADTPQVFIDIDRTKCESLGVNLQDVFNTLQVNMGGYFVNLFNKFGRTWQVNLMAEPDFRAQARRVEQLKVRNQAGEMVPLGTLVAVRNIGGPAMVTRYNMYNSSSINGDVTSGTSSGQAVDIIDKLAHKFGVTYEWTEVMFLQLRAGNVGLLAFVFGATLVYFILAAKYESWRLPLSVILVVPMCLLCAVSGMLIARMPIDIFVQIGLLVLVGMAAKNAILIVEFAHQQWLEGKPLLDATVDASRLRLRPIVMTSFAFILGVLPLVLGSGAGAEMRVSLGTAVFSGMIGVTVFGIFLTPVFFYSIMKLRDRRKPVPTVTPHEDEPAELTAV